MTDKYSGADVPDELVEALRDRLAHDDADGEGETVTDITQTNAELYAEHDASEDVPTVQSGDPGTYAGEYTPVYDTAGDEVSERDDLPEGYVPGAYTGPYDKAGNESGDRRL